VDTEAGLEWIDVARRLVEPKNYWLHTTGPTGSPNATPVWGVTVDGVLYLYTARSTVKARNLQRDPRVVIHLESGADVVIVHGRLVDRGRPSEHQAVIEAFDQKYGQPDEQPFVPSADPAFDVLYSLAPQRALLWSLPDTEASTRRWSAPGGHPTES
jgi:Pyridoxamine 5'-phosphate oxidase